MSEGMLIGYVAGGRNKTSAVPAYEGYRGKKKWYVMHPVWLMTGMVVYAPSMQAAIAAACEACGKDYRKYENYAAAVVRPMR